MHTFLAVDRLCDAQITGNCTLAGQQPAGLTLLGSEPGGGLLRHLTIQSLNQTGLAMP